MKVSEAVKQMLPDYLFNILAYIKFQGELPKLIRPDTFNQKILYRELFDRRPLLTRLADKYAVRDYVAERVGPHILPELFYVTSEPETIPFDQLPDRFVVKPTHGSGWVELVTDKPRLDREALIKKCHHWLSQSYYKLNREWPYKDIKPRILVEELIDDGHDQSPNDYKLFVYDGVTAFIEVHTNRFKAHKTAFYNVKWEKLPMTLAYFEKTDCVIQRPRHFDEMLEAAASLGSGLDFVRIDFYDTEKKLYFGEISITPGAGMERINPRQYDKEFGKLWRIRS